VLGERLTHEIKTRLLAANCLHRGRPELDDVSAIILRADDP
jgi:hypothetical protein